MKRFDPTWEEARLSIFEYVEVFYNRIRKHSGSGYKRPNNMKRSCEKLNSMSAFSGEDQDEINKMKLS